MGEITNVMLWTSSPFAVGGLVWTLKLLVEKFTDAQLKRVLQHEIETLKSENAKNLERLKGEIQRQSMEHQTRFTRLHERAFEITAAVYSRLVALKKAIGELGLVLEGKPVGDLDKISALDQAQKALQAFLGEYAPNAIFFDTETCDLLDQAFSVNKALLFGHLIQEVDVPGWDNVVEEAKSKTRTAERRLEERFRSRIGIE